MESDSETSKLEAIALLPQNLAAHCFEVGDEVYAVFEFGLRELELPAGLTQAERDVVAGVLAGKSNAEIAESRGTSCRTVANQLRSVYDKLGISGRAELLRAC